MTSPAKDSSATVSTVGLKRQAPRYDPEEYLLRKRLPARLPTRPNDIYVNTKTDFKAQLARSFQTLETEHCVYLHGLGAAAPRAINLALQLQQKSSTPLDVAVNTSTVNLVDDFEPQRDSGEFHSQERHTSAVHIKVYKIGVATTAAPTTSS